ncbi:hypothetical protein [Actinoplanes sp. NPDC049265]|uniref:hypothetical protein n=1 Tax=Actinoplanes sp. NPDC049265 TaxID=3363902 RepID=UPI003723568C
MSHHHDDRLRFELRQAADAYVPDRATIARRTATRRAAAARRDRLRPAAAALAVVAVAIGGVVAVQLSDGSTPPPPVAGAPPPPASRSAGPASTRPARTRPATSKPTTEPPAERAPADDPTTPAAPQLVQVSGTVDKASVANWTQNTVTVKADEPTWVQVTVRVERTRDASRAGWFTTVPNSDLTFTAKDTPDALLYTYTLKEGARLRPGTYVFAAQFSHGTGRDPDGDTFTVDARSGGADATSRGDFIGN